MVDIRKSTIDELATLLGGGGVSAVELLNSYIQAIQSEDEDYNAIAFLNPDAEKIALELDNERRNGFVRGPLHGIPILLKDNIDTADKMITSAGSLALNDKFAQKDAHLVERLRRAGAIILGPRLNRFKNGQVEPLEPYAASSIPLATLGTFILWLGWFGFNGGSQLAMGSFDDVNSVARIFMNTNLAAGAGVVVAAGLTRVVYGLSLIHI